MKIKNKPKAEPTLAIRADNYASVEKIPDARCMVRNAFLAGYADCATRRRKRRSNRKKK